MKQQKVPPGMSEPDTSLCNKNHGPKSRIRYILTSVFFDRNIHFQVAAAAKAEENPEHCSPQLLGIFWEYFIHLITVNVLETLFCSILLCLPMSFLSYEQEPLQAGITCKFPSKHFKYYRWCGLSVKFPEITLTFKII